MLKQHKKLISLILLALVVVLTFAACGDDTSSLLTLDAPENVIYDGHSVRWNAVDRASKYVIQINGGAEFTVTKPEYAYVSNGDFTISIQAKSNMDSILGSSSTTTTFRYLGKVESLDIDEDGTVTWLPVANATGYEVRINNQLLSEVKTDTSLSDLGVGSHNIQVRPVVIGDNSYFSPWSDAVVMTVLDTVPVDGISYDGSNITFSSVPHATSYNVYVDDELLYEGTTSKKVAYEANNTNFTVTVQAIGNPAKNIFNGAVSEPKEFLFLDLVSNLRIENGILYWDPVENADAYQVKINGTEVKGLTKTEYTGKLLVANKNLEVSVKPVSNSKGCFSSYSEPLSMYLLGAPVLQWNTDLSLDGGENSIYWDEVDGATGYEIMVVDPDGMVDTYTYGTSQQNFAHEYEKVGTYTVTARSLANEALDNIYSSLFSQQIVVVRPEAVKKSASGFITSDPTDLSKGFVVTCQNNNKAYSYQLMKNGLVIATSTKPQFEVTNLIDDDVTEGQQDMYSIKVMGGVKTVSGIINVTLNSKTDLEFKITILATPQDVTMEGYLVKYSGVPNANNGYAIVGAGSGSYLTENTLSRDISSYLEAGWYNVQVCAKGNGSDVLPSNFSPKLTVYRLAAPYNIHINTDLAANGILEYTLDQFATSIELYFNNNRVESVADVVENMNNYITTAGTSVKLTAVANYYAADGVYYMTSTASASKQFIKLSAPTNLTFSNTHLMWNQTGVSDAATGSVTYKIFNESNVLFSADKNTTSVDISQLDGGQTYNFYVQAIGDGETYINSDRSAVATIYKLRTPNVKLVDGAYAWNSITNASGYSVKVDGVLYDTAIHQSGEVFSFYPADAFAQVKIYTVTITAVGDGGINTISSAPMVIQQEVRQLAIPDFKLSYDLESYSTLGNIVATVTQESPYAKGYRYMFNNITKEQLGENKSSYSYNPNATGVYAVYVGAIGGVFDENGIYYVDSQLQGGDSYKMTLLAAPNQSSITLNKDGYISFAAVANTDKYEITVTLNDGVTYTTTVVTNGFDLNGAIDDGCFAGIDFYRDVTSVKVTIRAKAVLANKVTSEAVTAEWTGNLH